MMEYDARTKELLEAHNTRIFGLEERVKLLEQQVLQLRNWILENVR